MLSEQPLIYIIDDFLSAAECTRFLERAAGRMRRAQVVRGASDDLGAPLGRTTLGAPSYSSCWISNYGPVLAGVEQRIYAML